MRTIAIWLCTSAYFAGALSGCGDDGCDLDAADTICTVAGSGEQGFSGDDGAATAAALNLPMDVAVAPDGALWILDFNNFVVRAIGADGTLRTVVGNGDFGQGPEGVDRLPAREAPLHFPTDLAFHDGYLYLAVWLGSRIERVRLSDMTIEHFAGRGVRSRFDGDGGPALEAALDRPVAIALEPGGGVVIMDQGNEVIRRVDSGGGAAGGGTIRTIAGRCVVDYETPCAAGQQPAQCPGSQKLVCGDPAMQCDYLCSPGFGGDGGPALAARLSQGGISPPEPSGHMVYDGAGNLVFADTGNHRIRKIDPAGVITTIAGTGVAGYAGDGGPAAEAQLNWPVDLAIASDGTIYVTDVYNSCIRKIDPAGTISSVVGQCGADRSTRGFAGDGGPPLAAQLNRPFGLALDGDRLYIADTGNHRIRVARLRR